MCALALQLNQTKLINLQFVNYIVQVVKGWLAVIQSSKFKELFGYQRANKRSKYWRTNPNFVINSKYYSY